MVLIEVRSVDCASDGIDKISRRSYTILEPHTEQTPVNRINEIATEPKPSRGE